MELKAASNEAAGGSISVSLRMNAGASGPPTGLLGYAPPAGRTFLDRELSLPKKWAPDQARRAEARVGEDGEFAT